MKKIISLLILALLAGAAIAQNGAYVEYKMISGKGANGTMKGNYSEFGSSSEINMVVPQMPGGGFSSKSMTQKSNPELTYILNDKNKTYSVMKRSEMPAREDDRKYEVTKLGGESVNGYKCMHALVVEGKESHEVWNTKAIPDYEKYAESMKNNERLSNAKREKALRDAGCDGFPVKFVHKGNEREGEMTVELVKIEKKNFTKSDFEIPTGYTKSENASAPGNSGVKSQQEIMNMSTQERAKYVEEMKKKYGK